jgi:hypothetical protein
MKKLTIAASLCLMALLTMVSASDYYGKITKVFPYYGGVGNTDQFEFELTNTSITPNQVFQGSASYGTGAIRFIVSATTMGANTYKALVLLVFAAYNAGENLYVGTTQAGTVNQNSAMQTGLTFVPANGGNLPGQNVWGICMYK